MRVDWQLLGPNTVTTEAGDVELNLRPRTVLLRLLMEPNRGVSWEKVAGFLWADDPPKTQRNSVARFVADLRRALGSDGDRIVTEGGGYRVVVHDGELDMDTAQTALSEAKRLIEIDVELAHERVSAAMELVGTTANPWLLDLPEAELILLRNEETQIEVLETLAELKLRTGRHGELIAVLEQGVEAHPYHEKLWAHLVVALHRSARTAEALRACQRLRTELAEIGLEPSESIHRLEARIVAGTSPGGDTDHQTMPGAPTGRDGDLRAVEAATAAYPLVSIVGLAGSGKSGLAAAASRDEEFGGVSVYRVDMRSLRDATRVVPTVAAAVGVPASLAVASPDELAKHLIPVSCLIVLDNCEHLRPQCAALVEALVATAPGVRILVTGREPLRAEGEHVYRLDMLATRATDDSSTPTPAAAFFLDLASDKIADHDLDGELLDEIEGICDAVRGHPLAIELAAGLLTHTLPADLRAQLDAASIESPALAISGVLDVVWDSLHPTQQTLLARLAVFAGGCTLDAAESVCGERGSVAVDLTEVVTRGLVTLTTDDRYVLDAPIREFAAARLSDRRETGVVLDRLTDWLRELTAPWGIAETGTIAAASEVLIPEQANLVESLEHLYSGNRTEELAWFAVRSCGFWLNHGLCGEVPRWLGPVVDDAAVSDAARSAAATFLLEADLTIGNFATLAPWGEKAIELAGGQAHDWIPGVSGFLAMFGLMVPMSMTTEELLDMSEAAADRSDSRDLNRALSLIRRAHVAHHRRDYESAVAYFRDALALVEDEGRLLLALEMGETISLYLAGRRDEALESVGSWRSRVETDEWHYQVDIIRSIIVGGCGAPDEATTKLAAALRRHKPIAVWARADEFQTAFGLLADMRGEPKLSADLLATPLSGSPFLSSIVIEHTVAARGLGPEGFREVALELRARTIPAAAHRGAATSESELVSWWESGHRDASKSELR